jgi:hypothetical protein
MSSAGNTPSHPLSPSSIHLQPSPSLYSSRPRKNPRTRERKKWRRKGRRRREASAPPCGSHQHLQPNHGELKRLALILWIFPKSLICGFWWKLRDLLLEVVPSHVGIMDGKLSCLDEKELE